MSKPVSRDLYQLQPFKMVFWGLVDWAVIAGAMYGFLQWTNVFSFLVAAIIIGNRQHALGICAHDGAHYLVSRNRRINDFITNLVAFWPLGGDVSGYRGFHLQHHKNFLSPNDTERVAIHHDMGAYFSAPFSARRVLRKMLADALGLNFKDTLAMFKVFNEHVDKKAARIPLALQVIFWVSCIATGYWYVPVLWSFSLFSGYLMTFRVRIWLEHIGVHETHRTALPWWFAAIFAPHNTSHHWEHHRNPAVPFYNLPAMRRADTSVPLITLTDLIRFHKTRNVPTYTWMDPAVWEDYEPRRFKPVSEEETALPRVA